MPLVATCPPAYRSASGPLWHLDPQRPETFLFSVLPAPSTGSGHLRRHRTGEKATKLNLARLSFVAFVPRFALTTLSKYRYLALVSVLGPKTSTLASWLLTWPI